MAAVLRSFGPRVGPGLRHRGKAARLRGGDGRRHAAAFQCFESQRSEPAGLHLQARGGQALEDKDAGSTQRQLDGGQESDWAGAHNHNVSLPIHLACLR